MACLPHLLHVAEHILPAVEDALPLLRVQVEDEVSGIVLIALLIPAGETEACAGRCPPPSTRLLPWSALPFPVPSTPVARRSPFVSRLLRVSQPRMQSD